MTRGEQLNLFPEVAEYPFDPATKWMATVHRDHDRYFVAVKGAPEEVLALTDRTGVAAEPFDDHDKAKWLDIAQELGADGLRVLALAKHLRRESPGSLRRWTRLYQVRGTARSRREPTSPPNRAGITVAMATGDHPAPRRHRPRRRYRATDEASRPDVTRHA